MSFINNCFSDCGRNLRGPYLTAYQIALKHGFVGTEEQWIRSIGTRRRANVTEIFGDTFECDTSLGQVRLALEQGYLVDLVYNGTPAVITDEQDDYISFSTNLLRDETGDYYDVFTMSGRANTWERMRVSGSSESGGIGNKAVHLNNLDDDLAGSIALANSAVQPEDLDDYVPVAVFRDIENPSADLIEVKRDPQTGRLYVLVNGSTPSPSGDSNTMLITMTDSGSTLTASKTSAEIYTLLSGGAVNLVLIDYAGRQGTLIKKPISSGGGYTDAKFWTFDEYTTGIIEYSVNSSGVVTYTTVPIRADYDSQNAGKPLVVGSDGKGTVGNWPVPGEGGEPVVWSDIVPPNGIPATDLAAGVVPNVYYFESETQYNGQEDNILPGAYVYISQNVGEITLYRKTQSGKDLICSFSETNILPIPASGTSQNPSTDKGKVPKVNDIGEFTLADPGIVVPAPGSGYSGKVLKASGANSASWEAVREVPEGASGDNGKFLKNVNGTPTWSTAPSGSGGNVPDPADGTQATPSTDKDAMLVVNTLGEYELVPGLTYLLDPEASGTYAGMAKIEKTFAQLLAEIRSRNPPKFYCNADGLAVEVKPVAVNQTGSSVFLSGVWATRQAWIMLTYVGGAMRGVVNVVDVRDPDSGSFTVSNSTEYSGQMLSNRIYRIPNGNTKITITSVPSQGESTIIFTTPSTIPTEYFTKPSTMKMPADWEGVEASTRYEINVMDGYALVDARAVS